MKQKMQRFHYKFQEHEGADVWVKSYTDLRFPILMDLKGDPFERAYGESSDFDRWHTEHIFLLVPAQVMIGQFLSTFKEYPQRQPIGSFSIDKVLKSINSAGQN